MTTLLDIALGTGDPEELPMDEFMQGVLQGVISENLLYNVWGRSTIVQQKSIVEMLYSHKKVDLDLALINKMMTSNFLGRKIRVETALWLLEQRNCTPSIATRVLKRGVYRSKGIPLARFFATCMLIKPRIPEWDFSRLSDTREAYMVPAYAVGAEMDYAPILSAGLVFREDAMEILELNDVEPRKFINRVSGTTVALGKDVPRHLSGRVLISRSVCPRATLCSVILGHPNLSDDIKTCAVSTLANEKMVPLDNLIQLGTIPKEMFFGDLREHCRQSEHYVKDYHRLIKEVRNAHTGD